MFCHKSFLFDATALSWDCFHWAQLGWFCDVTPWNSLISVTTATHLAFDGPLQVTKLFKRQYSLHVTLNTRVGVGRPLMTAHLSTHQNNYSRSQGAPILLLTCSHEMPQQAVSCFEMCQGNLAHRLPTVQMQYRTLLGTGALTFYISLIPVVHTGSSISSPVGNVQYLRYL